MKRVLILSTILAAGLGTAAMAQNPEVLQQQAPNMPPLQKTPPEKVEPNTNGTDSNGPAETGSTNSLSDKLERSDGEVFRILHEPIDRLLDPANRFTVLHPSGWRGPAFEIGTAIPLWGFTAGVISMLFRLVGWEKPWDDSVVRRHPEVR